VVRKASAAANGLLERSERVLVVYEGGGATLYYETSEDAEDDIRRDEDEQRRDENGLRRDKERPAS
jgi:regulator of RNase E activity RraB